MKLSTVFNFIIFLIFINAATYGQANLQKNISLEVDRQRLDNVLEILSNKGDFYFSYNSSIIKKDSLVSFRASNKTVKEILLYLFSLSMNPGPGNLPVISPHLFLQFPPASL